MEGSKGCIQVSSYLWLIFCLLISFLFFEQIWKDQNFKKEMLEAPKDFIEEYRIQEGRIPTLEEFNNHYANAKDVEYSIDRFGEYKINVWRGEWDEYYSSKTKSFEPPPFVGGFILAGMIVLLIGFIPMLLQLYFVKK